MSAARKLSPYKLSLAVQYATSAQSLPTRPQFRRWIKAALQRNVQIALRIVDEAEGRALNRNFRGKDYATNVLTFVYDDAQPRHGGVEPADKTTSHSTRPSKNAGQVAGYGAGGAAGRLLPQREGGSKAAGHPPAYSSRVQSAGSASNVSQPQTLCGDIVICAPVVKKEAHEQNKNLHAHYAHLAIHAVLHLQGYDHGNKADAAAMEALETALLVKLGYADPYQAAT